MQNMHLVRQMQTVYRMRETMLVFASVDKMQDHLIWAWRNL